MKKTRFEMDKTSNPIEEVKDILKSSKEYVFQETVEPVRTLIKLVYASIGVLFSGILFALGSIFAVLGLLRFLESFKAFRGNFSWASYLISAASLVAIVIIGSLVLIRIATRGNKSGKNS